MDLLLASHTLKWFASNYFSERDAGPEIGSTGFCDHFIREELRGKDIHDGHLEHPPRFKRIRGIQLTAFVCNSPVSVSLISEMFFALSN